MNDQPPIELTTGSRPSFSVIWLHGLGADGSDFVPLIPELALPDTAHIRFIFPHAPYQPVTCNGGYVMRAWYDILSLAPNAREIDEQGLLASRATVRALIAQENARGIPSERIFLAGFSQGGAVAYLTALTHPDPLAGLIALSTYIPSARLLTAEYCDLQQNLPVFVGHGLDDDVVSPQLGQQGLAVLQQLGLQPAWHTYEMPHSLCQEEVNDLSVWLQARLNDKTHKQ